MSITEFCNRYYVERKNTNCFKWDFLEEEFNDTDLIPMWIADMDFKTPNVVREAIKKRVDHGVFGYTFASSSYFDSIIEWNKEEHNLSLEKSSIRIVPGIVPTLYYLIQIFTKKDDAVIELSPVYYPFHNSIIDTGRKLISCPLKNTNGIYTIDFKDFEEKIIENKVKMFINCSPHNPVGRVWDEGELDMLYSICKKHKVIVVADEIHQDIEITKEFFPSLNVRNGEYKNILLVTQSTSKTFNLAGFAMANLIIADEKLREYYDKRIKLLYNQPFNTLSLVATEAAYKYGKEWKNSMLEVIRVNYKYLSETIKQNTPNIIISPLEGTYLAWLDLRAYINPNDTKTFIQDKCRIGVDFGKLFHEDYKGFVRLNLATHPNLVKKATDNIVYHILKNKNNL